MLEETTVLRMGRSCDVCRTSVCAVYCRAESMYLCAACDASVHAVMRHERVRVCQVCERAPSAFLCKADSASLCGACDADVHSANPLARRHHRVPVVPISEADHESLFEMIDEEDENEAASWLLFNPAKASFMDEYLDLDDNTSTCQDTKFKEYFSTDQQPQYSRYYESVVPIQSEMRTHYHLEMECCDGAKTRHNPAVSSCHSVSVSSMEVVVVPESSTSDMSISHSRPPKGIIDLFSSPSMQMPTQLSPMDREARVMRYREKKKTRKFEKTIRYASRKAYAETRPRIKGRFAKRTDLEAEVDQMFSTSVFVEGGYGIVPSY